MCLAIPAKVIKIKGLTAIVDFGGGVKREVLVAANDVNENDYVMVHAGIIVAKVREEEVINSLKVYKEVAVDLAIKNGLSKEEAEKTYDKILRTIMQDLGVKID